MRGSSGDMNAIACMRLPGIVEQLDRAWHLMEIAGDGKGWKGMKVRRKGMEGDGTRWMAMGV